MTLYVPGAAPKAVMFRVEPRVAPAVREMVPRLKLVDRPTGETEAARLIVPAKPLILVVLTEDVAEDP